MSLLGGVTEQDRARWQVVASRVLSEMLERSFRADLPALPWRLDESKGFRAEVSRPGRWSSLDQRAAFAAWARFLGAAVGPERRFSSGRVVLVAEAERDGVSIVLRADLDPED